MISLELYGDPVKDKEKLRWQVKSSWINKPLVTIPVIVKVAVGIKTPTSFGKRKKLEAINHAIKPIESKNIFKNIDAYFSLLEGIVINNSTQVFKVEIEKFYSEKPRINLAIYPQINESFTRSTQSLL